MAALVFGLALVVRLVYLWESRGNPTFDLPLLDSMEYLRTAGKIAGGQGLAAEGFWQPPFYPYFLAGWMRLFGPALLPMKVFQLVLGAGTAALTCDLGRRLFDRRLGLAAGLIVAFWAPLFFEEGELQGTGWAAFATVGLVWLEVRGTSSVLTGIAGALAILIRTTFLPYVAVTALASRHRWRLAAGLLVVAVPAVVMNGLATGHYSLMPASSGLNLYIGNNDQGCALINTRPGPEWDRLNAAPLVTGEDNAKYYQAKVLTYALSQPLALLSGMVTKSLEMVSSREVPRNLDLYQFRAWSWLLRLGTWKLGPFGFPFGVLLPLAALGLWWERRRLPFAFQAMIFLYPLAVIAVFTSSRYRVPLVPLLAIAGAAGGFALWERLRAKQFLALVPIALTVAVGCIPGPFCAERLDYRLELYSMLAHRSLKLEQVPEAIAYYGEVLAIDPKNLEALFDTGVARFRQGDYEGAADAYSRFLALEPAEPRALNNLGSCYLNLGRLAQALETYQKGLALAPNDPDLRTNAAEARKRLGP